MTREQRMNREVELKAVKLFMTPDCRVVKYRLKTNNFFKRLFAKKGLLYISYYNSPGLTKLFYPDEFKEAANKIKTYADVKKWQTAQRNISRANKEHLESVWKA